MKIELLEIYYKNIREMKELTLDLSQSGTPKHISLIQMPNGVGKTTTMELIRYCFDGKAESLDAKKIRSFRPPNTEARTGQFRVKMSIDNKIKFVTIKFDYSKGAVNYYTTTTMTEKGGKRKGLELGQEIQPWIKNKEFVRLFVFDGELAGDLLKQEKTSAKEAINSLYLLSNLKKMYDEGGEIDNILDDEGTSNVTTNQAEKALQTKLRKGRECYTKLNTEKENLDSQTLAYKNEIEHVEKEIRELRSQDETLTKEYSKLESNDIVFKKDLEQNTEKLLATLRHPPNISNEILENLKSLQYQMTKLQLPKTQSMEFFKELAESSECICGRPIGEKEKSVIISKASSFLTEDNIGEINAIKTSIRNIARNEQPITFIEEIKKLQRQRIRNRQKRNRLDSETKNKEQIEELSIKRDGLYGEKRDVDLILMGLTEKRKEEQEQADLTWRNNIDLCEKHIAELKEKFAKATKTVELHNKATILKKILRQIHEVSLDTLKEELLGKTNNRIEKILKNSDIRIEEIDNCLMLSDREDVSEGQKLSIAYAFLSTLFNQSPHTLPFIVDTPAAPLDLAVRREVAEMLPQLFKQIVVFITSGERDGFADRYYGLQKECNFFTISKHETGVKLEKDLKYFREFQSEGQ